MNRPSQPFLLEQVMTAKTEEEYLRMREFTPANLIAPIFWVKKGVDGEYYVVFENSMSLLEFALLYPDVFRECAIASFGWEDNAFCLGMLQ